MFDTVVGVLDYSLHAIENGSEWSEPVPPQAVSQARRAARSGVSLGIVLRRYVTAHGCLGDFIAEETDLAGLSQPALQHLRKTQEALLERLTATIEQVHTNERERIEFPLAEHRAQIVRRLLAGQHVESSDLTELDYEFTIAWHLGVIATGAGIQNDLRRVRDNLNCGVLSVQGGDGTMWAWFGASSRHPLIDVEHLLSINAEALLALGEPKKGLDGWRQTHQEAKGALLRARPMSGRVVRYADSPLLSAALENDTLEVWLKDFSAPLRDNQDSGWKLLHTLRAYIDCECNRSSAAAILNVRRQTVGYRLRAVEELLDRPIHTCLAELDTALRLLELASDLSASSD